MREVLIMSRRQAETIEVGYIPVVSITDIANQQAQIKHTGEICRISFNDSSYTMDVPSWEVSRLFTFLEKHKDADQLIVHCEQGISRSSAVALFCCEQYGAAADFRNKQPNLAVVHRLRELRDMRSWGRG